MRLLLLLALALAQEPEIPDYEGDLWTRSRIAGDIDGARTDLAVKGLTFDVDFTQYVQGVLEGGFDETTRYGGHLDVVVEADLARLGVLKGGLLTVRTESRTGHSVNAAAGSIMPVNTMALFPVTDELDEDVPIAITNLYYTHAFSERLAVAAGKMDTLEGDYNEFASGRGKTQFMNANFLYNSVLALRLPYASLGAAAAWTPDENVSVSASLINTVDSSTTTGFGDFGDGLTALVEAGFLFKVGGLPGGANVGVLYSFDQEFARLGGLAVQEGQGLIVPSEDDTWALYAGAWQYLSAEESGDEPVDPSDGVQDRQGVGIFARAGVADRDTNPASWSVSLGVGGRGLIPSRDNDTFGAGACFTHFEETLIGALAGFDDRTYGFEAYYTFALTPAAHLSVDVQAFETLLHDVDTAYIVGARLNLAF